MVQRDTAGGGAATYRTLNKSCVNSPSSVGMGPLREFSFRILRNHHPPQHQACWELGWRAVRSQCNTHKEVTAVKRPSSVGRVPVTAFIFITLRDRVAPASATT
jgi:hypothetical protein